jgi:hypothetical protein
MEWTDEIVDRLYVLHQKHIDALRADVVQTNRSLGSSTPERTNLERLGRNEFQDVLTRPCDDRDVTRLWVRRMIAGHEHTFPELATFISPVVEPAPGSVLSPSRRRTGT